MYPLKYVFRPDSAPEVKELERAIVKCAMSSDGIVSPSEVVAAYSEWGLDEVRARLDAMANKGYVEMRATKSGSPPLAYVVPEFLADASRGQLAHDGHAPTVSSGRPSGTVQNQSRISPCSKVAIPRLPFPAVQGMLLGMREEPKKPVGRPRKYPWPEPIPDDPENIMRIIMRTPRELVERERPGSAPQGLMREVSRQATIGLLCEGRAGKRLMIKRSLRGQEPSCLLCNRPSRSTRNTSG